MQLQKTIITIQEGWNFKWLQNLLFFDCQVTFGKLRGFISDFSGTIQSVAMAFAESGCYPAHVEKFCTTHATIKFAIIKESFNFEELTNGLSRATLAGLIDVLISIS